MKKFAFILAFCLLCGGLFGCNNNENIESYNEGKDYWDDFSRPWFVFESLDDLRACYEILDQDEETVQKFLDEKGFLVRYGLYNKEDLQGMLTCMESCKFPYPIDGSAYRLKEVKFFNREYDGWSFVLIYYNEADPFFQVMLECSPTGRFSHEYFPAEDKIVVTLPFGGIKIPFEKLSRRGTYYLSGYHMDGSRQCFYRLELDSDGKYDPALNVDSFILTDLRTLLFDDQT